MLSRPRSRPPALLVVESEGRGTTLQKLIVESEGRGTTLQKLIVDSESNEYDSTKVNCELSEVK